jgi:hypothetical protein
MSWGLIAYILAGLFVVFYVLPNGIWWITVRIDRYIHSSSADPHDASLKDREHGSRGNS